MEVNRPCQLGPRFFLLVTFRRLAGRPRHDVLLEGRRLQGVHPFTSGEDGTRTRDLLLAKQALYQLSYFPARVRRSVLRTRCARTWIRTRDLSFIRAAL